MVYSRHRDTSVVTRSETGRKTGASLTVQGNGVGGGNGERRQALKANIGIQDGHTSSHTWVTIHLRVSLKHRLLLLKFPQGDSSEVCPPSGAAPFRRRHASFLDEPLMPRWRNPEWWLLSQKTLKWPFLCSHVHILVFYPETRWQHSTHHTPTRHLKTPHECQ